MTTEKQIEANRKNAKKSTGPKTEEGKARSSQNAMKHGLTAGNIVLPGEDMDYFEQFRFGLFDELRPEGALETQLVLRLAAQQWRLQRIPAIEAGLWERLAQPMPGVHTFDLGADGLPPDLSRPWLADSQASYGGALGRLARYEAALERSCTRLLNELRRLQRERLRREEEWEELHMGALPPRHRLEDAPSRPTGSARVGGENGVSENFETKPNTRNGANGKAKANGRSGTNSRVLKGPPSPLKPGGPGINGSGARGG